MTKPRAIILTGDGINCDYETEEAFTLAGARARRVHINDLPRYRLTGYNILALPGGFSFGDDLGAGKLLASKLEHMLGQEIREFIAKDGLVIGICNGAQAAVKMGIVPALDGSYKKQETTLTFNNSGRFEDRWINLRAEDSVCVFTEGVGNIYLPVAHGEGKFVCDDKTLKSLQSDRQIAFRYATDTGEPAYGAYPANPNGSVYDVAGICDPTGRVLALMPHPERHLTPYTHPRWTRMQLPREGDGLHIFRNAVKYFE